MKWWGHLDKPFFFFHPDNIIWTFDETRLDILFSLSNNISLLSSFIDSSHFVGIFSDWFNNFEFNKFQRVTLTNKVQRDSMYKRDQPCLTLEKVWNYFERQKSKCLLPFSLKSIGAETTRVGLISLFLSFLSNSIPNSSSKTN